jgi:two-component system, NtrC family, sensor kinase
MIHSDGALLALLNSTNACTAIVDVEGRIVAVNRTWEAFVYPNPFITGLAVGADFRQACTVAAASPDGNISIVALGVLEILRGKIHKLSLEYPVHADGKVRWFGLMATTADREAGLGMVMHILDITDRMESKQRLHRTEQLFKVSTENALNLFCILNTDGYIQYASPSYAWNLGVMLGDWKDHHYESRVHEDDRKVLRANLSACIKGGLSQLFEYRLLTREKTWKYLEGRASQVEGIAGDPVSLLLISQDITVKKEAETERALMEIQLRHSQKMEAIGQLAAGIAHEINTPIQYLGDNLRFLKEAFGDLSEAHTKSMDLLERRPDGDIRGFLAWVEQSDMAYLLSEAPKAFQQSEEGIQRIATIVNAMKVFSHPGNEGRAFIDLNQALETTLLVAKNEWKYVAEVKLDLDPELPKVDCYPGEINQVFLNLVVNAAHAIFDVVGDSGLKGVIGVQTRVLGDQVEIRISDTGTGIPEKVQPQIFLPFFTTKAVGKGTGQGLSIVHSVVAKHRGTVDFETQAGKGTVFVVKLPVKGN